MICSLKWGGLTLLESYLISLSFVVNGDGDSVHEYYHCVPEDLIPNHYLDMECIEFDRKQV